jgi:GMP synthase (glutamine-hydrolysing)
MNIHWLQHVPFEGLGAIETWAEKMGYTLSVTRLFAGDPLPQPDSFAMLVVMGGPMGIYDEQEYPWLKREKSFLQRIIQKGKPVLGICLGAQLVADALGSRVKANKDKEIGWFPVERTEGVPSALQEILPGTQTVFHWHGDTFDLPADSELLYTSEACCNQAFVYKDRVIALQFHLETTKESAAVLVENCRHELVPGPWIQTEQQIIEGSEGNLEINETMDRILDYLVSIRKRCFSPNSSLRYQI